MGAMAMAIPLLGALWPLMALAIALFAPCSLVFRLQWQPQNLINNI